MPQLRTLFAALLALPLVAAACGSSGDESGANPYDGEYPVSEDNVNDGAPDNDSLPDDNKADAVYPATFQLDNQSPVKSQGSRGVCSMFAATALVENVYIVAGMPVAEADFSEQYMQWGTKNLSHEFENTEGSSSEANLGMVVDFGTVKESAWPYESAPWTAANDAECTGGENLPTKCYTNGEPPASIAMAQKFKLPQRRWINRNSIKAHITAKKTGVNVGMTFFYQSWNHRKSTLPVDADLWRRGVVTYPSADDKTESAKHRAGHAIHIIGWDDNLEIQSRDKEGKPVVDANGQPVMEKGFWLFKNSWGTASFGVDHPYGPGYGWLSYKYVAEYGSAVVAELPTLDAPKEVCDDAGNADEDGDMKANCDDSDCAAHPSCGGGNTAHTYTAQPNAAIPDNNTTGVSSTLNVDATGSLTDVKVTVDITHTYRGDLTVTLQKGDTTKTLIAKSGGAADNLQQTFTVTGISGAAAGEWVLKVVDSAAQDTGTLKSWTLEVATN